VAKHTRWILYAIGIVIVVVWLAASYYRGRTSKKRRFPWPETAAAAVAFAGWGLVMPGNPLALSLGNGVPLKDKVKATSPAH
jgi:hypothetical protein